MSEHSEVRIPVVKRLIELGWDENQIQFSPEWRVPKTPSEASKREKGQSFKSYPVDIAIFDTASNSGNYQHLQIIVETKKPNAKEGINQLEIYMSLEPYVILGIWTNGSDIALVYRTPSGQLEIDEQGDLPRAEDSLIKSGSNKLTWNDLKTPDTSQLKKTFSRLLDIIVSRDTISTRRDDQLNNLCNIILAKLEGDKQAKYDPDDPLDFQVWESAEHTEKKIKELFAGMRIAHGDIFHTDEDEDIKLDADTIQACTYELGKYRLRDTSINVISEAFQIFRTSSLKSAEGQYYTPYPVIRSAIKLMEIKPSDKVLDPACGTGGFLLESFRHLIDNHPNMSKSDTASWANRHLYGVDKDRINVKLTKAIMLTIGDGSTNIYLGDSLRSYLWPKSFPELQTALKPNSFTCIVTNPPFGQNLKVSDLDSKLSNFSISRKYSFKKISDECMTFEVSPNVYQDREIGIVFVEKCYELLMTGGRLGIILPETYMFSAKYSWLRYWLRGKLELKGMLNIPMEAFQGFCRAKTNFYIFQKIS